MNSKIEARLERSLRNQVRAPKLDGRFDAAVWARIEKASSTATASMTPARPGGSRWLFASNLVGAIVTVALVGMFGLQAFTGAEVNVALPTVAPGLVERLVTLMIWPVTVVALSAGFLMTSAGRRLRAELF